MPYSLTAIARIYSYPMEQCLCGNVCPRMVEERNHAMSALRECRGRWDAGGTPRAAYATLSMHWLRIMLFSVASAMTD